MKRKISFTSKLLAFAMLMNLFFTAAFYNTSAAEPVNFAAGKPVTVSKETAKKVHGRVTDGKKDISGSASAWNVHPGEYIVIDLQENTDLNQVIVYEYSFQRAKGYKLEVSKDNQSWTTVSESDKVLSDINTGVVTNTPHYAGIIKFNKTNARYVKLTIKELTENKVTYIEEIEVYNAAEGQTILEGSKAEVPAQTTTPTSAPTVTAKPQGDQSNLALGASVTVSKAVSGKKHELVTDGKKAISATASAWNAQPASHIILDLGKNQEFNQVVVYEYSFQRAKGAILEVSEDNKTWKKVSETNDVLSSVDTGVVTNTPHYAGLLSFDKVNTRYIKLTIKETTDGKVSYIEEIEVYNASDPTAFPNSTVVKPTVTPELSAPKVANPVPYADDKFDIYLFIGQSNMNGRDSIPAEDMVVLDKAFLFNADGKWEYAQPYSKAGSKYSAVQGFNRYSSVDNDSMNGMNSALSFARALCATIPNDTGIGIISNARGGTSIEQWQKGSGENLYEQAVERTKKALALGGNLKAICWLQGESCASKPDYLQNLNKVAEGIRGELGFAADQVPFIASQVPLTRPTQNETIKKIATVVPNSDWISSEGTDTIDKLHFDAQSQRLLGIRYAVKVLDKVYQKTTDENTLYQTVYGNKQDGNKPAEPDGEYKVIVNGKSLEMDVPPMLTGDRLFVPLRIIFETLNATVEWEEETQTITARRGDTTIIMQVGSENASINGNYASVDVAPMIVNDRTLVPIRFVSESLGATVDWSEETKTATITLQ